MPLNFFLEKHKHIKETRFRRLNAQLQKGVYPKSTANIILIAKCESQSPLKKKKAHYLLYYLTLFFYN